MNKDVIYIEPEDDITDIISKLENSKEKIIALVPPKKAGVLRSVVNIKLITKSALNAGKNVVLVTTDPSIIKLAAITQLPVTKDLQTAPAIPTNEEISSIQETKVNAVITQEPSEESADGSSEIPDEQPEQPEELEEPKEDTKEKKTPKKDKKSSKNPLKWIQWIKEHKKISIACACFLVLLIGFLIWAFVIAPAVSISVVIKTTSGNFSENISLVSDAKSENTENGAFFYETRKKESKQEATFTATGTKNIGEKASGTLSVYAIFKDAGSKSVNAGDKFINSNLEFISSDNLTLSWDGADESVCQEGSSISRGCIIRDTIHITASEPGEKYNILVNSGWRTTASIDGVEPESAMSGGTDDIVTVITQEDINKAQESLKTSGHTKEAFFDEIAKDESIIVVAQSYKEDISDPISTPAVNEEVKNGVTPKLTVTTTQTVLTLDKTKVEEFISQKAKLGEDQKIYSINDSFIENLSENESGFTGKLKTTFKSGSKVTENDILENIKGKKVGEVKAILSSITGVIKDDTKIETSYFWVSAVPNDPNKITINLEIKED